MDNLIFSLNATMPIFLMMCLGYFLRRVKILEETIAVGINGFVFKVALPATLFYSLATQDFRTTWNGRFVLFCMVTTVLSILIAALIARFAVRDRGERGEFIQAAYRSSAAILGMAFIQNIYGEGGSVMGPLMILGSVPLYNICAVVVLTATGTGGRDMQGSALMKKTLKGIVTNPILIGVVLGFIWSAANLPFHSIPAQTVQSVGRCATPLGLITMGALFEPHAVRKELRPVLLASCIKLVGLAALFLPVAVLFGMRGQELIALLVMYGSSCTVSSYIMAVSMGHSGVLTSGAIMFTTLGCSFTLTFWLFLLRSLGLI